MIPGLPVDDVPWEQLAPTTWAVGRRVVHRPRSPRKRDQILRFYREAGPWLKRHDARVPELVGVYGDAILTERVQAEPVKDVTPEIVRAAGAWLHALHSAPVVEADPLPLDIAIDRRWDALLPRLPEELRQRFDSIRDASVFADAVRVWCHRDFHPRNWLWDGQRLWVVDVEHALPDAAAVDFARIPAFAEVLAESYPGMPSAEQRRQALLLDAAGAIGWAARSGDTRFVADALQRLQPFM